VSLFKQSEKSRFLLVNLAKGLAWLLIIIIAFVFMKKHVDIDFISWLQPLFDNNILMYSIFLASEVIFGIITPELFFIWALKWHSLTSYYWVITFLAIISYCSGVIGYSIGRFLNTTRIFRLIRIRYLSKYDQTLNKFGLYLILVAALTPVPFSAICMMTGSVGYPMKKFLLIASSRFLRFWVYAAIIWEANTI